MAQSRSHKVIEAIQELQESGRRATVAEIIRHTGLRKNAVEHYIRDLQRRRQLGDPEYRVGASKDVSTENFSLFVRMIVANDMLRARSRDEFVSLARSVCDGLEMDPEA